MTPTQLVAAIAAAMILAVGSWGVWQWSQKLSIQHQFDTFKVDSAREASKQQEVILQEVQRGIAKADAARVAAKSAVEKVKADYGPTVAAYNSLRDTVHKRLLDLDTHSSEVPPAPGDAGGTEGSACDKRVAEIYRRYAAVVEAAGRVTDNFQSCVAGIARYGAAVGWAGASEGVGR